MMVLHMPVIFYGAIWAMIALNLFGLVYFAWPRIKERLLRRQAQRRREMLKLHPSRLKEMIGERDAVIAHLEDELLHLDAVLARLEAAHEDQRAEIKLLSKRNGMMAREVRCDQEHPTEVFRDKWSGRF